MRLSVSGSSTGVLIELEGVLASIPCRQASVVVHADGEAPRFIADCFWRRDMVSRWHISWHPFAGLLEGPALGERRVARRLRRATMRFDVPQGATVSVISDRGEVTDID